MIAARTAALVVILILGGAASALTQPVEEAEPATVGLVLSGGSAKGFAHIGVIQVLHEAGMPVHVVTGTSMGSLIGGLYAMGFTYSMLVEAATLQDWDGLFHDAPEPEVMPPDRALPGRESILLNLDLREAELELPVGYLAGQRIFQLFARLTWPVATVNDFRKLTRPFVAIGTDLETGDAVVLDHGSLAQAMRASMSLPGIFAPIEIEGRFLADGGLVRNLPAEDALALGADILICVDVGGSLSTARELNSLDDILKQTIGYRMAGSTREQIALCDILIEPDTEGISTSDFDEASAWIERGRMAARAHLDELRALARSAGPEPLSAPLHWDPVMVRSVEIEGVDEEVAQRIRTDPDLRVPGLMTAEQVDRAIARLYGTGEFELVTYRLDHSEDGGAEVTLVISTTERHGSTLGMGFRFENEYSASLLLSGTRFDVLQRDSMTRVILRLGEQMQLNALYAVGFGRPRRVWLAGSAGYMEAPLRIGPDGADPATAEIDARVSSVTILAAALPAARTMAAIGLEAEVSDPDIEVGSVDFEVASDQYVTIGALFLRERLDEVQFPSRGSALWVTSEVAVAGASFSRHLLEAQAYQPLGGSWTGSATLFVGNATGSDLPLHGRFYLGGSNRYLVWPSVFIPFHGLEPLARSGRAVQVAALGLRYAVKDNVFATLEVNGGDALEEWEWDPGGYELGWGVSLGARSFLGPASVSLAGTGFDECCNFSLNVGHSF